MQRDCPFQSWVVSGVPDYLQFNASLSLPMTPTLNLWRSLLESSKAPTPEANRHLAHHPLRVQREDREGGREGGREGERGEGGRGRERGRELGRELGREGE